MLVLYVSKCYGTVGKQLGVNSMNLDNIKNYIRNVPDFPCSGIQFKDVTTAIKQPHIFSEIIAGLAQKLKNRQIDYVIGIEARGFIFGAALAIQLKCGFVPVRKPGKLPAAVFRQEYSLEYGTDCLEMHQDALEKGSHVIIVDDLLATGGTAKATAALIKQSDAIIEAFAFVIELTGLRDKDDLEKIAPVYSLIRY